MAIGPTGDSILIELQALKLNFKIANGCDFGSEFYVNGTKSANICIILIMITDISLIILAQS